MNTITQEQSTMLEKKRDTKKTFINIALLIISGLIFMLGLTIFNSPETSAIYYLAMTVGIVGGFISALMIIFGGSSLFYTPTSSVVKQYTLFFDIENIDLLLEAVNSSDFAKMPPISKNQHSGLKAEILVSADRQFAQCSILKYVPYNYEPIGIPHAVPHDLIPELISAIGKR